MRVGLVVNPTSGRGRHGGAARVVSSALVLAGHDVLEAYGTTYDESRLSATALLESSPGLDALVVVGGDGTVHLGLDVVATTKVPLGIVAVGTGNDIARHLGLPVHDAAAATTVITEALAGRGAQVRLDAIHSTRPDGSPVPDEHEWSLAVVSAGIDAAVNVRANSLCWPKGEGRYLRATLAEIASLSPYGYRLTTDSGRWEGPALLLAVANTRYFGGGLDLCPGADATDGLLDVVRLDPVPRRRLLRLLSQLYKGTHLGQPGVRLERTRALTIEALGPDSPWQDPPWPMADGEAVANLPLRLEAVPQVVTVLMPG